MKVQENTGENSESNNKTIKTKQTTKNITKTKQKTPAFITKYMSTRTEQKISSKFKEKG